MKSATRSVVAAVLGIVVVGCDGGGTPPTPTGAAGPPDQQPGFGAVKIVSGADGRPVAGASVSFEGDDGAPALSGPDGEASPVDSMLANYGRAFGTAVDVDARGFLPRRTRVPDDRVITLWPVADEAEAEAVREMVYGTADVRYPVEKAINVVLDLQDGWDDAIANAWWDETSAFGAAFGVSYGLGSPGDHACPWECTGRDMLLVQVTEDGPCEVPAGRGFCADPPGSHARGFTVRPGSARDAHTIRGVLASWFLGPNPLPGLLNAEAPADALSPLEAQTIRMTLLRPLPNRWPDTDR